MLEKHQIDTIVNFAAESHVDRSVLDADAFMHTNSIGVYILLDEGRKHGIGRFLQVSTDEVYGSVPQGELVETDPLAPRNPYSAAKAGGELMARAYYETHDMNVVITRGSNTFGPYQYPEKLIPFFITEALEDHPLPLYGDGKQMRDWLYVEDHVGGIDLVLHKGKAGEAYNIAGEDLRYNIDVTHRLLRSAGQAGGADQACARPRRARPALRHELRQSPRARLAATLQLRYGGRLDRAVVRR